MGSKNPRHSMVVDNAIVVGYHGDTSAHRLGRTNCGASMEVLSVRDEIGSIIEPSFDLSARFIDLNADYPTLAQWWSDWGWDVMEAKFLPKIGIMIGDEDRDICAAFLWLTDSKIAIMEMFISDKTVRGPIRSAALDMLIDRLKGAAKELGYEAIYTTTDHKHVVNRLEKDGFHKSKDNITSLMGRI